MATQCRRMAANLGEASESQGREGCGNRPGRRGRRTLERTLAAWVREWARHQKVIAQPIRGQEVHTTALHLPAPSLHTLVPSSALPLWVLGAGGGLCNERETLA